MRVCTYNCMNLFAWQAEPQEPINPAKPQREVRALAKTIAWANPDILAMQEVGSLTALVDINSLLDKPFPYVQLAETNSDRGIHLGFMSRIPFQLHSHREWPLLDENEEPITDIAHRDSTRMEPLKLSRDIAVAELTGWTQKSTSPLLIACVHLKSAGKRPWNTLSPLAVRTAEVCVLAKVVDDLQQRMPDSPLIALGDFNDNPTSPAFDALDRLKAGALYDPVMRELVPANPRISTYWPKRRSRIDRILLNANARKHYQPGSIKLWGNKRAEIASDHFPLTVDLTGETPQKIMKV